MDVRGWLTRFAPTAALAATLVLLVVLLPARGGGTKITAEAPATVPGGAPGPAATRAGGPAPSTGSAAGGTGPVTPGPAGGPAGGSAAAPVAQGVPGAAGPAAAAPSAGSLEQPVSAGPAVPGDAPSAAQPSPSGAVCRPEDGRQPGITRLMPPCLSRWGGDNGGGTARGVFPDKVIVARWIAQIDPATEAALVAAGGTDRREDLDRMNHVIYHYVNNHYETYGRQVVWVDVEASGNTDESARADAVKIDQEIGAFAVTGLPPAGAEEAAARDLICICTVENGRTFYKKTRGRVFTSLHVLEEYYETLAEYVGKRLVGRKARFAGDTALSVQDRKFGLVWLDQQGSKEARDVYEQELAKWGVPLTKDVGYTFDITNAQAQATNILVQMKAAGVTTLTFVGDPLYPIFLTKEATRQAYFPEWLQSGTFLTDTTFFGRLYDQAQWTHSFGISPLWVFFVDVSQSVGYREYHHVCPQVREPGECDRGDEGISINVLREGHMILMTGFHMAGPNLTPDTYTQGMFSYPPTGGLPKVPKYYWTLESPTGIKDFTEIWYDGQGRGKDETGKEGVGVVLKMNGGKRYDKGQWPITEPNAFDRAGTVFTTDDPPEGFAHEQDGHTHPAESRCLSC